MLTAITPVLLTYNEMPNIAHALAGLSWAGDVVVVDSNSNDGTAAVLARAPRVRTFQRRFDTHAGQWRFAMEETGIATQWVLRLDADYRLTEAFVAEIARLDPAHGVDGYEAAFDYAVFGHRLHGALYPPNVLLLRRGRFSIHDDGHTERWRVSGKTLRLKAKVIHDDWKSTARWLENQSRYMTLEEERVTGGGGGAAARLRQCPPIMPLGAFLYCMIVKGGIFDGRAGLYYALQRLVAEAVLALMLLERRLTERQDAAIKRAGGVFHRPDSSAE